MAGPVLPAVTLPVPARMAPVRPLPARALSAQALPGRALPARALPAWPPSVEQGYTSVQYVVNLVQETIRSYRELQVRDRSIGERDPEDLTGRARIRDTALRLFAERGMDGATVRDIAAAAGVSPGLVRHHFGSKDGLREACDSYVLDRLMRLKEEAVHGGRLAEPGFMSGVQPDVLGFSRYLARSMVDGSPAAAAMFDHMVELGEQWLSRYHPGEIADPRAFAAMIVAVETGILAMNSQLSRALGADILSPAGQGRLARAKIEFYSHPLLGPDLAAQARAAIDDMEAGRAFGQAGSPATAAQPGSPDAPASPPRAMKGGPAT